MRIEEPLNNHGLCLVFGHYRERLLEISGAAYQDRVKADSDAPSHRCNLAHHERDERVCDRVRSENGNAGEVRDELAKELQPLTCQFRPVVDMPVMLAPGRAKLSTRPFSTGAPAVDMTIGIVRVASLAAIAAGVKWATM